MTEDRCYFSKIPFETAQDVDVLPEGHPSKYLYEHRFLAHFRAFLPQCWAAFPGFEVDQLEEALTTYLTPVDYSNVNIYISAPTDSNISRWIHANF